MTIPVKFRRTAPAIVSYDATDLSNATGYETYYGGEVGASGGNTFLLSPNAFYSETIATMTVLNTTTFAKVHEFDFDLTPFQLPKVIDGVATINVTAGNSASGGGASALHYIIAKIIHYDGTTETILVTSQSATKDGGTGANSHTYMISSDVPLKRFKKGEILRIHIEHWVRVTASSGTGWSLAHDPKDRNGGTYILDADTSMAIFTIPFRIDN